MCPRVWRTATCALVSADERFKCQRSHSSLIGQSETRLKTSSWTFFCSSWSWKVIFFCKHEQLETTCGQAGRKPSQSMSAPNFSTCDQAQQSQSAWSNQSANHPTSFIQSERRTVFSGDYLPGCQMDLDRKPWQLCDIGICCPPIMSEGCVIWERERERNHGRVPGHLYESCAPQTEINPSLSSS